MPREDADKQQAVRPILVVDRWASTRRGAVRSDLGESFVGDPPAPRDAAQEEKLILVGLRTAEGRQQVRIVPARPSAGLSGAEHAPSRVSARRSLAEGFRVMETS